MNRIKLCFFALIFLLGATILVPALLPDIASADCGAYVRDNDIPDRPAPRDCRCNIRDCVTCNDRDYDRPVDSGCYRCNAGD